MWTGEWRDSLLEGEVGLVTGGGQGIGFATARQLGLLGARVVVLDLHPDDVADRLQADGVRAIAIAGDVREPAAFDEAVARAGGELGGPPSIFVSNAGITRDSTIRKMTPEQWHEVIDVHLLGAFTGLRAVFEGMQGLGRGAIVFLSSVASFGAFGQANYSSAKAGLIALARVAALEFARYGIRVNCVAPGVVDTAMVAAVPEEIRETWLPEIPLRRMAEPEEMARVIAFLCSPLSSYVTGTVVLADGGYSIKG